MKADFYVVDWGDEYVRMCLGQWVVPKRYINFQPMSQGTHANICSATDTAAPSNLDGSPRRVSVKKLTNPFNQDQAHAQRAYRELRMLRYTQFHPHPNIVGLVDAFTSSEDMEEALVSDGSFDLYFVTPLMFADLSVTIQTQTLNQEQVQFITYQLLRALKYIHSAGIHHRNLRPTNILLNQDCQIKISDMGMEPTDEDIGCDVSNPFVASRWYCAPEVLLKMAKGPKGFFDPFEKASDLWSVGCILAEMILGQPILPGSDAMDQANKIMTLNLGEFFPPGSPVPDAAVDLVRRCLERNETKRINVDQALNHPYLQAWSRAEPNGVEYIEAFDNLILTVDQWKQRVWNELHCFSPFV